jgi:CRP-like cAMP-binding protein
MEERHRAILSPMMREVSLAVGQKLFDVGESAPYLVIPGTAVVSVVSVMRNGACVETVTVGCEGTVGALQILANRPSSHRAFVQIGGSAVQIAAGALRQEALRDPLLLDLVMRFVFLTAAQAELSAACNALHDVQSRFARWVLMTRDRVESNAVPLTQDFLAIMLGVQRTTVTKAATDLKAKGVITYRRGQIQILQQKALEAAACECYAQGRALIEQM